MDPLKEYLTTETRRQFFGKAAMGLGAAALATLMPEYSFGAVNERKDSAQLINGALGSLHFAPKAKRAIYLFMSGAPSQLDMFDYKPKMADWFDVDLPESIRKGQRLTTMTSGQSRFPIAPSIYKFKKYESINHDPAITYICTGDQLPGKPSLGAWLSYGLGSDNEDLPAFVVMNATWTGRKSAQALYNRLWGSGFLPSEHQGVLLRSNGDPVLFLSNPAGVSAKAGKRMLDTLNQLNRKQYEEVGDPETHARISQYELAFRMQTSVPELTDISTEPQYILDMYGPDVHKPGTFAHCCLLSRRLAERGVLFTQIFHRGWDQHGNIPGDLPNQCRDIDQPATALIQDLKQRGMLDDTLVVWGGEFGRTIYCQGGLSRTNYGRDHHPKCYTKWMAGGGVQGGVVHGETDSFSYNIVRDPVHIHDLNATILNQLGVDHRRLAVKSQGLDQRLTGVEEARVVKEILA